MRTLALMVLLSACGPMPAPGNGAGGGAAGGGFGSFGAGAASGGGMAAAAGGIATLNCNDRCRPHFTACGAQPPQLDTACDVLCQRIRTDAELRCVEAQSCNEDPLSCLGASGGGAAGGGSATGGGNATGGGAACPIPASQLRITFPYFNAARGVALSGGSNCSGVTGYTSVWASRAFVDATTNAAIQSQGGLFVIEYEFEQRALTSADTAALQTATGIEASLFGAGEFLQKTAAGRATIVGGTPTGIQLIVQVTSNARPKLQFAGSSSTLVGAFKSRLDMNGVTVTVELQTMNGARSRTATFFLKGSTLTVRDVAP